MFYAGVLRHFGIFAFISHLYKTKCAAKSNMAIWRTSPLGDRWSRFSETSKIMFLFHDSILLIF